MGAAPADNNDISSIPPNGPLAAGQPSLSLGPLHSGTGQAVQPLGRPESSEPSFSLRSPFDRVFDPARLLQTPSGPAASPSSIQPSRLGARPGGLTPLNTNSSPWVPETSPLTPLSDERRSEPLDSNVGAGERPLDGRDDVAAPWVEQWLRSNADTRFRITPVARRLFHSETASATNNIAPTTSTDLSASAVVGASNNVSPVSMTLASTSVTPSGTTVPAPASEVCPADAPNQVDGSDANVSVPALASETVTSDASNPADASATANGNDGGSEMGSTNYNVSDLESDFLEEAGPFLDVVYIAPANKGAAPQAEQ
ncbi:hypothetical protein BDN70DRAFT_901800 [Pholiota conissans]|uniref:Uncharacterized protein n=1 Tax=Pholiota conissans TaxID=109636 RepID=A0A9P5YL81_9AGAR|nr:hypothetical protein BDN70DRAFT_901800 [Pholiota conissans]